MIGLVGMTRAQIADPHMVIKIRDGREDEIKQCVGANYCIDRQYNGLDVLCIQNAATSREATMPHIIEVARPEAQGRGGRRGLRGRARREAARPRRRAVREECRSGRPGDDRREAPQREQMSGIIRWFDMETKPWASTGASAWPPTRR